MNTNELVRLMVASGAVRVTPEGRVTVDAGKLTGHWVDRGRGWQREGGGADEQDTGQGSRDSGASVD